MAKTLSIIVAVAENNGIGLNNELLTYISNDLKHFKCLTTGHTVVMGHKTWLSLPIKPLPGRKNIVITKDANKVIEGAVIVNSIEEAVEECPDNEESFIIGGAMVYEQFLQIADKLYLTKIHKSFEADTFFSEVMPDKWKLIAEERIINDMQAKVEYSFLDYKREVS